MKTKLYGAEYGINSDSDKKHTVSFFTVENLITDNCVSGYGGQWMKATAWAKHEYLWLILHHGNFVCSPYQTAQITEQASL